MPRQPRYEVAGLPQHIVQRGNNRQPIFFEESDYRRFLDDLKEAAEKTQCQVHAFVLMTNHVHLLATPTTDKGLSQLMQSIGRRYVQYINTSYKRSGTLWEGRYKASLIDEDNYLLTCMRYIELNPVRAGIVENPSAYQWSSHQWNAFHQDVGIPIVSHPVYLALAKLGGDRRQIYRDLFDSSLNKATLTELRATLNQCRVLGNESFKDKIETLLHRKVRAGKPGRPKKVVDK